MTTQEWQRGVEDLAGGEFWEAHEAWEEIWRELPASAAREAMQALIQFVAACYKIDQVRQGRPVGDMQQGMAALIGRARGHLDRADQRAAPTTTWSRDELRAALDRLELFLETWRRDSDLDAAESSVATLGRALAGRLAGHDSPVRNDE